MTTKATEALLLLDGPRHGWAYPIDTRLTDPRLAGYRPITLRDGTPVWSTVGEQLRHYRRTNPELAALPCRLLKYEGNTP